jgi:hypothetical protein
MQLNHREGIARFGRLAKDLAAKGRNGNAPLGGRLVGWVWRGKKLFNKSLAGLHTTFILLSICEYRGSYGGSQQAQNGCFGCEKLH